MTITCNLYIDGQWHDAEGRRTFTRRHPAHDDVASVAAAARGWGWYWAWRRGTHR